MVSKFDGINWFLDFRIQLQEAKSYFNNFWLVLVKNGRGLLGHGTPKSTVSQE